MRTIFALLLSFYLLSVSYNVLFAKYVKGNNKPEDLTKPTEKDAYYGDDWSKMDEDFEKALNSSDADDSEKGIVEKDTKEK